MKCGTVNGSEEINRWNVMGHCYLERGMEPMECKVALLLVVGNGTEGMQCGTVIGRGM